jgi:hypothetical protein
MNRYGLSQQEIDEARRYGITEAEMAESLAALDSAERRHAVEAMVDHGRGGAARGAQGAQNEGDLEAEVHAYAKEHKVSIGAAYEALGKRSSAPTGRAGDGEEGELEKEVRAYAAEHKCPLGVAYVAVGAKRARADREAREQN